MTPRLLKWLCQGLTGVRVGGWTRTQIPHLSRGPPCSALMPLNVPITATCPGLPRVLAYRVQPQRELIVSVLWLMFLNHPPCHLPTVTNSMNFICLPGCPACGSWPLKPLALHMDLKTRELLYLAGELLPKNRTCSFSYSNLNPLFIKYIFLSMK